MQILTTLKSSALLLAIGTLAACGGGGGGGGEAVVNAPTFGDVDSTANSNLVALILNPSTEAVTPDTGSLNRGDGTGNIGGLSGTLSDDRSQINLTGGGVITFSGDTDAFAVRFDASQDGTTTQGIAGIATSSSDLPSGSASYSGDTVITATSGTDVFELTGTAEITASFGASDPSVTTTLSDLSGLRLPALSAAETVADAGTLTLNGSAIDGSRFTGGTAELDSDVLSLAGSETVDLEGAFYGPSGEEVGGVFAITGGETQIFGDFLAN